MLGDHDSIAVLAVTDLDRARTFYEDVLGLTSPWEAPEKVL
jgi:catechol 2,3-dioxygenase-like lactoylglutathione lyase family enzyme